MAVSNTPFAAMTTPPTRRTSPRKAPEDKTTTETTTGTSRENDSEVVQVTPSSKEDPTQNQFDVPMTSNTEEMGTDNNEAANKFPPESESPEEKEDTSTTGGADQSTTDQQLTRKKPCKRARTAYFIFMEEKRPEVQQQVC